MFFSVTAPQCASFRTIDIVFSFTLLSLVFILLSPIHSNIISRLYSNREEKTSLGSSKRRCKFALVYNEPSKNSSTYITNMLKAWAETENHPFFECGSNPHETASRLQDFIPTVKYDCGVLACHGNLHPAVTSVLQERLPNYRLMTSTRYPAHRIISHYLQKKGKNLSEGADITTGLRNFLLNEYNPSGILALHTGISERRKCPISEEEEIGLYNIVSKYHIVIDANLKNESNVILNRFGLFSLPDDDPYRNVRDLSEYRPPRDVRLLLRSVSCYERAWHKALQMRMASVYENILRIECVKRGRIGSFTSCLAKKERRALVDSWLS